MHSLFYIGVVENRNDPLRLGRCQVRIFGVHSESKSDIPTEDLPWAIPVMPITGASTSGIGFSPTGVVEGTTVILYFQDGESKQMPIMLGSFAGIPIDQKLFGAPFSEEKVTYFDSYEVNSPLSDPPKNVVKDNQGSPIRDGSGNFVTAGEPEKSVGMIEKNEKKPGQAPQTVDGWSLGQTSAKFESNGNPGTINDYLGSAAYDPGGASYGSYQLTSYLPATYPNGSPRKKGPNNVKAFILGSVYKPLFEGLEPATPAFDAKWKEVAKTSPAAFAKAQHDFIQKLLYEPALRKLSNSGFNISNYGPAVKDLVWSTAVQFGPSGAVKQFAPVIGKVGFTETDVVNKVSEFKINNVDSAFSSSPSSLRNSIKNRFKSEKVTLLELTSKYSEDAAIPRDSSPGRETLDLQPVKEFSVAQANNDNILKTQLGFVDPKGVYPKKDLLGEPDTNRLARNNSVNKTIVQTKEDNAVKAVKTANEGPIWDEPLSPYAAAYPFNHVYQSESGHVMEFDDSPNAERMHFYHNSGTYTEIDRNGRQVNRIVGDGYEIIDRNGYIYIAGTANISVGGNCRLYVAGQMDAQVDGNAKINCHSNVDWSVAGTMNLSVGETLNIQANKIIMASDTTADLSGTTGFNVSTDSVMNIKAASNLNTQAGGTLNLKSSTLNAQASSSLNILAGGNVNIDGSAIYENSGTAGGAADAAEAAYPGLTYTDKLSTEVNTFKDLETSRRDAAIEFEFDGLDELTEQNKQKIVDYGLATKEELEQKPIEVGPKDTEEPKKITPNNILKGDCATIASLDKIPDSFQLSPNFNLYKIAIKAPAGSARLVDQYGLTTHEIVCNLQSLCINILEPIKREFPNMFVTNTLRNNNTVSGSVSQHCLGQAADLQFSGVDSADYFEIAQRIKQMGLPFDQLLLEYKNYGSKKPWIHISFNRTAGARQRQVILTFFNNRKHSSGLTKLV